MQRPRIIRSSLQLPRRPPGRLSREDEERCERQLQAWCNAIVQLQSTLDFDVSARGWCYVLEEHGLNKDNFDTAEGLINKCRKSGKLPVDICSEDEGRSVDNLEDDLDTEGPEEYAQLRIDGLRQYGHESYTPLSFWDEQTFYVEMAGEKIDLKSLFGPVCGELHVAIFNAAGWSDINTRFNLLRRFSYWHARGKICVLLYCGDHDPKGLQISDFLRANLTDVSKARHSVHGAIDWQPTPDNLIIERFGLNADFIRRHNLTWIDNLKTSGGKDLSDQDHPDHFKDYVQDYLRRFGARKVEANALVVRPEAGRELCRAAILRYVDLDAVARYEGKLQRVRSQARRAIRQRFRG